MDNRIRRPRTEALQLARSKAPRAIRYPASFRAAAVALAGPRLERGGSIARVARDLGLPIQSLGRWLRPSMPALRRLLPLRERHEEAAKVLLWDGTRLCIYAKRLEQGRFACLWRNAAARVVRLTMSELQLFLEGSALVGLIALSPAPFVVGINCARRAFLR